MGSLFQFEMTIEDFIKKVRAVRCERRVQYTGQFSRTRSSGFTYQVFVDVDALEVINPYSKKNKQKKTICFNSEHNADTAKRLAYDYIKEKAKDLGLFEI